MTPLTGYALHFVISHRTFDVMAFEKRERCETDHKLVKSLPKAKQTVLLSCEDGPIVYTFFDFSWFYFYWAYLKLIRGSKTEYSICHTKFMKIFI